MPDEPLPRALLHLHEIQVPEDEEDEDRVVILTDELHTKSISFLTSGEKCIEILKSSIDEGGRPSMYDLFVSLCAHTDRRIIEVLIHRLSDKTYIATIRLMDSMGAETTFQALPLDGLICALKAKCPIYATENDLTSTDAQTTQETFDELDEDFFSQFPGFDPTKKH